MNNDNNDNVLFHNIVFLFIEQILLFEKQKVFKIIKNTKNHLDSDPNDATIVVYLWC